MLMEDYLNLKELFSPEVLWEFKPARIPGRVSYKFDGGKTGKIEPLVEIYYPDGKLMKDVYSAELNELSEGDKVIFRLQDAREAEKIKKNQPNLKQACDVEFALEEHLEKLSYEFDPAKIASLGRRLKELIEDLDEQKITLQQDVKRQVIEQLKIRVLELDGFEKTLKDQQTQIQTKDSEINKREETIDQLIAEQVAAKKLELETRAAELELRSQKLVEGVNLLKSQKESLEGERQQLARARAKFQEEGGEKFVGILDMLEESDSTLVELKPLSDVKPPKDLLAQINNSFSKNNYISDSGVSMQFLLSTLTAAVTGQFVVLSGPTGVGKTSMVNAFSSALGAGSGVVPVRPSWIDPTDLLGFYNPQQERFQPSPFMDLFLNARKYSEANRLYFLTLDEMNLSRVENYAADFLSRLEKAHTGEKDVSLQLYSVEVEQQLRLAAKRLKEKGGQEFESAVALLNHVMKYPANITIPEGLVMFGTINLDETTFHLSPKFLDRSFVINISHQELLDNIKTFSSGHIMAEPVFEMSLKTVQDLANSNSNLSPKVQSIWKTILEWREEFLEPLGIRLGFRFASMFATYMQLASKLEMGDEHKVAGTFLQAKLLPWISFHKDDKAVGNESKQKIDVLREWVGDNSLIPFTGKGSLRESLQKIIDRGSSTQIVQYLE